MPASLIIGFCLIIDSYFKIIIFLTYQQIYLKNQQYCPKLLTVILKFKFKFRKHLNIPVK